MRRRVATDCSSLDADCNVGVCNDATDACEPDIVEVITVQKAEYRVNKSELKVEARSDQAPGPVLTVTCPLAAGGTSAPLVMPYDAGKNLYELQVKPVPLPAAGGSVTVSWSVGGVGTKAIRFR